MIAAAYTALLIVMATVGTLSAVAWIITDWNEQP